VKASSKYLRAKGRGISNESILQAVLERDALVAKKSRKQRQREEEVLAKSTKVSEPEPIETSQEPVEEVSINIENIDAFEPIDFDDIRRA
jgi:putative transposase